MGSNKQTMTSMVLDTGSSPLWMPEATCVCSGCTDNNQQSTSSCFSTVFSSTQSSTFKDVSANDGQFTASYGDGTTVSGPYSQDTVSIGALSMPNYVFGLITSSNAYLAGIMGFAPQEDPSASTVLNVLAASSAITTKQFSIYYPPSITGAGSLYIGGSDTTLYDNTKVTWVPVTLKSYWEVPSMNAILPNGQASGTPALGIIDTGTSFVVGPTNDIKAICTSYGLTFTAGAGCSDFCCGSATDCSQQGFGSYPNIANMPNFKINFGGGIQLSANIADNFYLVSSTLGGKPLTCTLPFQDNGSISAGSVAWIVGAAFIRQYYTIYDFTGYGANTAQYANGGTGKVGFAIKGSSSGSVSTAAPITTASAKASTASTKATTAASVTSK